MWTHAIRPLSQSNDVYRGWVSRGTVNAPFHVERRGLCFTWNAERETARALFHVERRGLCFTWNNGRSN